MVCKAYGLDWARELMSHVRLGEYIMDPCPSPSATCIGADNYSIYSSASSAAAAATAAAAAESFGQRFQSLITNE